MKIEALRQKLLAAARANPPGDHVPYAFEKRVSALLFTTPLTDLWTLWSRALWKATVPCLAVTLLLGAISLLQQSPATEGGTIVEDLTIEFEQTMLAAVEQNGEVW
jgi:hypothetical protein